MKDREQLVAAIRQKFLDLTPAPTEALRRRWVALEARALGRGGISLVATATGVSPPTIAKGLRELDQPTGLPSGRSRRPGGGRKPLYRKDAALLADLTGLLGQPAAAPIGWSVATLGELRQQLRQQGHRLSESALLRLLRQHGYRWQRQPGENRAESRQHWRYLTARMQQFLRCGQPVLAVELLRGPSASGQKRRPAGSESAAAFDTPTILTSPQALTPAALLAAALHCFLPSRRPAPQSPTGDLLVVISPGRRRTAARHWQREAERLAAQLQCGVELLLLPSGIYQWGSPPPALSGQILVTATVGGRPAAMVQVGQLRPRQESPASRTAALYSAAYPDGLVAAAESSGRPASFRFCARSPHRRVAAHRRSDS
jgi:transposase